jgi:hypothetical protein
MRWLKATCRVRSIFRTTVIIDNAQKNAAMVLSMYKSPIAPKTFLMILHSRSPSWFSVLLLVLSALLANAQPFKPDQSGYVRTPDLKAFMKAKGYFVMGAFYTRDISDDSGTHEIVLATAYNKNGRVYLDLLGNEIKFNEDPYAVQIYQMTPELQETEPVLPNEGRLMIVNIHGKYGTQFIKSKKMALPAVYDHVTRVNEGHYLIKLNDKEGIAARDGRVLIKPLYDSIKFTNQESITGDRTYSFTKTLHYDIWQGGKKGYIDNKLKLLVPPLFDDIARLSPFITVFKVWLNNKVGLWRDGKLVADVGYTDLTPLSHKPLIIAKQNKKTGILDSTGQFLMEMCPLEILEDWQAKYLLIQKNGKTGVMSYELKVIVPPEYDFIHNDNGFISVNNVHTKGYYREVYGLYNYAGKLVLPARYAYVIVKDSLIIAFLRKGMYKMKAGLFDRNGKAVLPMQFDDLCFYGKNLIYRRGHECGLLNAKYQVIKKYSYEEVVPHDGFLFVKKRNKYGAVDSLGKVVVPIIYDNELFRYFNGGLIEAEIYHKSGRKQYMLDMYGNRVFLRNVPNGYVEPLSLKLNELKRCLVFCKYTVFKAPSLKVYCVAFLF